MRIFYGAGTRAVHTARPAAPRAAGRGSRLRRGRLQRPLPAVVAGRPVGARLAMARRGRRGDGAADDRPRGDARGGAVPPGARGAGVRDARADIPGPDVPRHGLGRVAEREPVRVRLARRRDAARVDGGGAARDPPALGRRDARRRQALPHEAGEALHAAETPPPLYVSAFHPGAAAVAGRLGDGLWCLGDPELAPGRDRRLPRRVRRTPTASRARSCCRRWSAWGRDDDEALEGARPWKGAQPPEYYVDDSHDPAAMLAHGDQKVSDDEFRRKAILSADPDEHVGRLREVAALGATTLSVMNVSGDDRGRDPDVRRRGAARLRESRPEPVGVGPRRDEGVTAPTSDARLGTAPSPND